MERQLHLVEGARGAAVSDDGGDDVLDLVVVGGGVMGLFTAYRFLTGRPPEARRVAVLERGRVGDRATASFGRTRSYRRDYLDPLYGRLADRAIGLWDRFEAETGVRALVRCGCLNLASAAVTPDLDKTYAARSGAVLRDLGFPVEALDADRIAADHPYLRADLADLDPAAGLVDLDAVTGALLAALPSGTVREGVAPTAIDAPDDGPIRVTTPAGTMRTRALVITAGHGTNDVLALLPGPRLHVPLARDRPSEARYVEPPADVRHRFTADVMPVMAYLDTGIYLHPIVPGVVEAVKVGYYNPPDVPRGTTSIDSVQAFLDQVLPGLADAPSRPVTDVDQCDYDLVADDDFVLGPVPDRPGVYVGVGWRGTGYKFAPWVGSVLADLAAGAVPDDLPARFAPARFLPTSPEGTRP
jgi:sarcosine oxidase